MCNGDAASLLPMLSATARPDRTPRRTVRRARARPFARWTYVPPAHSLQATPPRYGACDCACPSSSSRACSLKRNTHPGFHACGHTDRGACFSAFFRRGKRGLKLCDRCCEISRNMDREISRNVDPGKGHFTSATMEGTLGALQELNVPWRLLARLTLRAPSSLSGKYLYWSLGRRTRNVRIPPFRFSSPFNLKPRLQLH